MENIFSNENINTKTHFTIEDLSSRILHLGNRDMLDCNVVTLDNKKLYAPSEQCEIGTHTIHDLDTQTKCDLSEQDSGTIPPENCSSDVSATPMKFGTYSMCDGQTVSKCVVPSCDITELESDWRVLEEGEEDPWGVNELEESMCSVPESPVHESVPCEEIIVKEEEVTIVNTEKTFNNISK